MKTWIDQLRSTRRISDEALLELLACTDADITEYLHQQAHEVAVQQFGHYIYIRGLIEISNCCKNDCYYCGIRKSNTKVDRYRLTTEQILECCEQGYNLGFRTFVMQGGEDRAQSVEWIEDVVHQIRTKYPDCAITLSLGEMRKQDYERLFAAGANRYLLRHETYNTDHYAPLHPSELSFKPRQPCLRWLK